VFVPDASFLFHLLLCDPPGLLDVIVDSAKFVFWVYLYLEVMVHIVSIICSVIWLLVFSTRSIKWFLLHFYFHCFFVFCSFALLNF
jgi:hypothetical protein